jgi:hypothetical protein
LKKARKTNKTKDCWVNLPLDTEDVARALLVVFKKKGDEFSDGLAAGPSGHLLVPLAV